eukprot:1921-Heterococcus_DN1.PRE.1
MAQPSGSKFGSIFAENKMPQDIEDAHAAAWATAVAMVAGETHHLFHKCSSTCSVHLCNAVFRRLLTVFVAIISRSMSFVYYTALFICRHCPYLHQAVADPSLRKNTITQTVLIKHRPQRRKLSSSSSSSLEEDSDSSSDNGSSSGNKSKQAQLYVLFWSGGKDSFLTLRALQAEQHDNSSSSASISSSTAAAAAPSSILLLTTCDAVSGSVAFQNTHIRDVMAQATALSLDLLAVPLVGGEAKTAVGPYVTAVLDALESLKHR